LSSLSDIFILKILIFKSIYAVLIVYHTTDLEQNFYLKFIF
jgi:hypothetical protein